MGAIAPTAAHVVRLKSREEVAERTMAFYLEKPPGFTFKPGQYLDVTLPDPPETDEEGNTRTFSIASAPHESALIVATRLRESAFKRVLASMPLNREVKVEGPFGNLTMHNNAARAAVLIAGGIGITPFRSMVLRAAKDKLGHRVILFYSNRRPEDAPFLAELQALEKQNPNYRFVGVMTQMEKSAREWQGERGLLSMEILSRHLDGVKSPVFYLAGPPVMVSGMLGILHEMGIDEDDIRTEEFAGY